MVSYVFVLHTHLSPACLQHFTSNYAEHAFACPKTRSQSITLLLLCASVSGLGPAPACVCLALPSLARGGHLLLALLLPSQKASKSCSLHLLSKELH